MPHFSIRVPARRDWSRGGRLWLTGVYTNSHDRHNTGTTIVPALWNPAAPPGKGLRPEKYPPTVGLNHADEIKATMSGIIGMTRGTGPGSYSHESSDSSQLACGLRHSRQQPQPTSSNSITTPKVIFTPSHSVACGSRAAHCHREVTA